MLTRIYLKSIVFLLILTVCGKLVAGLGEAPGLDEPDRVFKFASNREVLIFAAALESAVAVLIVSPRLSYSLAIASVAWLGTVLLFYRSMLWASGYKGTCDCLGNLIQALHLTHKEADFIAKGILAYLLVGSYILLVMEWRSRTRYKILASSTD